jgi:hypothetical protein
VTTDTDHVPPAPVAKSGPDESDGVELQLSPREWGVVLIVVAVILVGTSPVWRAIERFTPDDQYRIPYPLSEDYAIYQRLSESVPEDAILVAGDSVIWGEFTAPGETLTAAMNDRVSERPFRNGGLNGSHPLALEGLLRHYAGVQVGGQVILHCNLLWMSAAERDLSLDPKEDARVQHVRLIPQLTRRVPAYLASLDERLGTVVDRALPYRNWVHHLRIDAWDGLDLHTWTLEHPYANPLSRISTAHREPSAPRHGLNPPSWSKRGLQVQDLDWIPLETSVQWHAFRETVTLLQARRNRIFVLIGPFNEHLLTAASRARYRSRKQDVARWLTDQGIPFLAPEPLPSELYADASHPLAAGYARLANQLLQAPAFTSWLQQ